MPAPGQNVVYADVDGHIGYHTTGHIPIRTAGDGSLPVSERTMARVEGLHPVRQAASVYDPPSGIWRPPIRASLGQVPFSISGEWDPPWRTDRIYQVLESGRKFAAPDMLSLQTDVYSALTVSVPNASCTLDHVKNLSPRASRLAT